MLYNNLMSLKNEAAPHFLCLFAEACGFVF